MRTANVIVPLISCVMTQSSWAESGQRAAHITARQAAKGRLAHQMCNVEMWPWRMDLSRRAWALMRLKGRSTSMRRLGSPLIDDDLVHGPRNNTFRKTVSGKTVSDKDKFKDMPKVQPIIDSRPTHQRSRIYDRVSIHQQPL